MSTDEEALVRLEAACASKGIRFSVLRDVLKQTGSVVAGGSIFCSYWGLDVNDVDIFVPSDKLVEFVGCTERFVLVGPVTKRCPRPYPGPKPRFHFESHAIDVIPVVGSATAAALRFDIGVCRAWFDGDAFGFEDRDATTRTRVSSFRPETTDARVQKYRERGVVFFCRD